MAEQARLIRNQEYKVRLYPSDKLVDGRYLGIADGENIFSCKDKGEDAYIFVSNHEMEVRDNVVSYRDIHSSCIEVIRQGLVERMPECSRLFKKINPSGGIKVKWSKKQ